MAILKKKPVEEKKPTVKVEKPAEEKKEKPKKIEHKIDGRKIGKQKIESVSKRVLNGRTYNEVKTLDGLTYLLPDDDFKKNFVDLEKLYGNL